MDELVWKNVLFYNVMHLAWRWVVSKVEGLKNYMPGHVVETMKGKIRYLPEDVQDLLSVMAYVPNSLSVPILKVLLVNNNSNMKDTSTAAPIEVALVEDLLKLSSNFPETASMWV